MADGLSIAASVAGLVSLGFQVCSGITTYLDGLKCRAEELESARKYEQSLKASIQAIDKILSQPDSHHQNSSTDITECIKPCKDELKALEGLVAELCGDKKTNPSLLDKAKASKKRLTYAFDRPKLSQLQAKVGQAIQSLQLALQILGLESSSSLGHTLQTIEITSKVTAAEIVAARADVTALAGNVSTLRDEAPLIRAAVEKIGPSLLDLDQLANQSVQGMQAMREDANLASHMLATKMEFMINQLAALQSQSTINQHATTELLQLAQQDNRRLFTQMVSRPSYLEEISEECFDVIPIVQDPWKADRARISDLTMTARDGGSSNTVIQSRFGRNCNCRARKRLQHKQVVWSGISFFQDDVYSDKHFPTCQFWRGTRPAERKWGLRQAGIGWLAQKAIEITFSCKWGSGGASFSPNFTYYPTVDESIAPSFRLISAMDTAMGDLFIRRHSDCDWQCILERGFEQLEKLFREGRASPNDMNDRNQTLIYPLSGLIWGMLIYLESGDPSIGIILDFVKGITRFEIPSNIYDAYGQSPIKGLTAAFYTTPIEAVNILFDGLADVPSLSVSQKNKFDQYFSDSITLDSIIFQMESQMISEAYGCGQLSQAVLGGDVKRVGRILQKDPASMMEVNCWGQTPLHLSISQPDMLQVLLQHCSPSQLNKLDNHGYTALHYAFLSSPKLCRGKNSIWKRCRKCRCARSLKLLLKAGCAVDIGVLRDEHSYYITPRCLSTLVRGLKDRRNKLQQLALVHLPDCDIITFIYLRSGRVLDAQTSVILGLLEAKGVHIPPSLRTTQQQKTGVSNGFPGRSVYHVINDRTHAELFWSHGFWDIDEFTGHFDEVRGDGLPPIATCKDRDLIMWFFNRGVNLFRELRHSGGGIDRKSLYVRTAHFVYRQIGDRLHDGPPASDRAISSSLHAAVLPAKLFDNCVCSCSKQGCTPFLMLVKALKPRYPTEKKRCNSDIVDPFLIYLEWYSYKFTKNEYKEALRYFTFTAFDLNHTCYHKPEEKTFTCSVTVGMCEDAMHVRDEQADMIELLEEVLFDLGADLDNMMLNGNHFNIRAFFTDHWLVRVEKELEKISGHELSEDFKKETEALGVVWNEAAEQTDSDSEDERGKPLQYWLDAIDRAAQL